MTDATEPEVAIEPGDLVYIGNGKLTWEVLVARPNARHGQVYYELLSGNLGRRKFGFITGLRLHSKGSYAKSRADHPAGKGKIVTGL